MAAVRDAREQQLKPTTLSVCFLAQLDLTGSVLQPGNACTMVAGVAKILLAAVVYFNPRVFIMTNKKTLKAFIRYKAANDIVRFSRISSSFRVLFFWPYVMIKMT